ncbi:MAG: UDP-N-acetylglucosamine pyrophosphorylase [Clostridia bacterium]|nr:UDP-N-acetylglucosamine pyrophosphorylase [Clostridia bacterium]
MNIFNLSQTIVKPFLESNKCPWEWLNNIEEYIKKIGETLDETYERYPNNIWISKSSSVAKSAEIIGPCIIGHNSKIKHCAYIRENVIIGEECSVGNSCEIKNSILFNGVRADHYNYIGDSILGYKAHLGAGVILSNLRLDKKNIVIQNIDTNRRKVGSFIGDNVEIGCNSVLNPGVIVDKNIKIPPLTSVKGIIK